MRACLAALVLISFSIAPAWADVCQATGVKVGEITDRSAIVWVRLTARPQRNPDNAPVAQTHPGDLQSVNVLPGACPGRAGQVRLRYGTREDLGDAVETEWVGVNSDAGFTHQFPLADLEPHTLYYYESAAKESESDGRVRTLRGSFRTAPAAEARTTATFTVITGQCYTNMDDADGFRIYDAMLDLKPDFIVPTGDTVYYDRDFPYATTVPLARFHWHRTYSLPRVVRFHLSVPGYWEKDDHDTLVNDCWPAMNAPKAGDLTFEQGCRIFREQVPMGEKTYRMYRWGKLLQVWMVEGRDFRSPNTLPDGPDKTIWGPKQKKWLTDTLLASDADWKVLVSPTPIVGPDRSNKADNHANKAFAHEGNWFREWATAHLPHDFFVVCGDRHWQYHSVHPETGLQEFSCGPTTDRHAGGTPGKDPRYHRFHRVKGGFLSVSVAPAGDSSEIAFRFHDVAGAVVYEYRQRKR